MTDRRAKAPSFTFLDPEKRLAAKMDALLWLVGDYLDPEGPLGKDQFIDRVIGIVDTPETVREIVSITGTECRRR